MFSVVQLLLISPLSVKVHISLILADAWTPIVTSHRGGGGGAGDMWHGNSTPVRSGKEKEPIRARQPWARGTAVCPGRHLGTMEHEWHSFTLQ